MKQKVKIKVAPPGPNSLAALQRLEHSIGQGNYMGLYGLFFGGSNGVYLEDLDGNIYLDCLTGAASNNMGYSYHQIPDRYNQTAKAISHTSFSYSPTIHAVELAEHLIRITPGTHPKKVFLGLSGSNSIEDAIEVVWKYTKKKNIIRFQSAYHGATWLTKCASGFNPPNSKEFTSEYFYTYPFPTTQKLNDVVLEQLETALLQKNVGGVLIEPILADAGVYFPYKGFMAAVDRLLKKYGGLLIVDEIQCGMGRTGKWWSIEHEEIVPDLLVVGKGLAAGYAPISALVGKAEAIDSIGLGKQIGTFIGHPPSAAAAIETIKLIEEANLITQVESKGKKLIDQLKGLTNEFPDVLIEVRGRGLLIGLEVNILTNKDACRIFAARCMEKGLYLGYYGVKQEVLRIAPPYVIADHDMEIIISTIRETAKEMQADLIPKATIEKVNQFAIGLMF